MKIKKILCPIDFSEHSLAANHYASALAKTFDAEILYFHSFVANFFDKPAELYDYDAETKQKKQKLMNYVCPSFASIPHKYFLEFDLPLDGILKFQKENEVDLIVMGSHGRTGASRLLMGSFAEFVVRKADCPVMVVKATQATSENSIASSHKILCPVDFSHQNTLAISLASAFARRFGSQIVFLHVASQGKDDYGLAMERTKEDVMQNLKTVVPTERSVNYEHRVEVSDNTALRVCEVAEEIGADQIVMATHGRTGIARVLMGSIAEKIVRRAPCPVLTIRDNATLSHDEQAPVTNAIQLRATARSFDDRQ